MHTPMQLALGGAMLLSTEFGTCLGKKDEIAPRY